MRAFITRALIMLAAQWLAGSAMADGREISGQLVDAGVAVSFRYQPDRDGAGMLDIAFSDPAHARPLDGVRPAAWMQLRRSEQVADEQSCADKARSLMSGSLGARADVDLNSYRLVTLNQDRTLAFINPHIGLQNTKLESIVQLPAVGYDWVHSERSHRLFVTMRDAGAVAVIDTVSRRLLHVVSTGEASLPTRLAIDEDADRVWVGLDGSDEVLVMDAAGSPQPRRLQVGRGVHTLTVAQDTPWIFVTNSHSNTVTRVDRNSLQVTGQAAVGQTPVAARWSVLAQRLVVLSINAGEMSLVNPSTLALDGHVRLAAGVVELGLFDGGRYAVVLNTTGDVLSVVDLSSLRVTAEQKGLGRPDQIIFSRDSAYVRTQASANVHVVPLAQIRTGSFAGVPVPMGRKAPGDSPEAFNVAGVMAQAPESSGVLVANPGDGRIYSYAQGLMVPTGSFSNYRRQARALMVLDSSLRERAASVFSASARFLKAGRYDLVIRNLRPSVTACFTVAVQDAAEPARLVPAPRAMLARAASASANALVLEFKLLDGHGLPVDARDATVLLMARTGAWQARIISQPLGGGVYRAVAPALAPGDYEALVRVPSAEIAYENGRLGSVRWPLASLLAPPQESPP
ncbi:MAG: hypothetical protein B7X59_03665 [Polaromonas sp. 39-63-203]|jgi:YVTN family beta-propeller protein|uniref:YncE family protein n=1 Tax=Polaromonas sp. TaxID=1869339 RepID=UPI000BCF56E1|nr:YncE family protein [Polaromonas sp.]OYY54097.1 MAG: hypothetical protein B7Y54_00275 [Polaromonas sp. 35-63-240]OYZ85226.1 MAG: hypothetical protein B7Y03_00405 [Polaromonas sp. 24-62-144]OZA99723.1 MAG: hypothetical protein B7X59_03665 [Polaromonas sp. 39-63-203]HQS33222.1 YncE family protein [Polaromonas sp.]HQS92353.1 YncE family protein [Polaromonas sp.]